MCESEGLQGYVPILYAAEDGQTCLPSSPSVLSPKMAILAPNLSENNQRLYRGLF
jgi:hypothetical protein